MTKLTLSRSVLVVAFIVSAVLAAQSQVPLWLGKMQQVKLFEHKRPDLIRVLGEPDDDGNTGGDAAYYFDWGHMFVLSVDEVCSQRNDRYPGDIAKNKERVGELRLYFDDDQKFNFADLGLFTAGYDVVEAVNQTTNRRLKFYNNYAAGRSYEVREDGTIESIAFIPSREEVIQACR